MLADLRQLRSGRSAVLVQVLADAAGAAVAAGVFKQPDYPESQSTRETGFARPQGAPPGGGDAAGGAGGDFDQAALA